MDSIVHTPASWYKTGFSGAKILRENGDLGGNRTRDNLIKSQRFLCLIDTVISRLYHWLNVPLNLLYCLWKGAENLVWCFCYGTAKCRKINYSLSKMWRSA